MNFIDQVEMLEKARANKITFRREWLEQEFRNQTRHALTAGEDTCRIVNANREDLQYLEGNFSGEGWYFCYYPPGDWHERFVECRFNRPYTWLERLKARL